MTWVRTLHPEVWMRWYDRSQNETTGRTGGTWHPPCPQTCSELLWMNTLSGTICHLTLNVQENLSSISYLMYQKFHCWLQNDHTNLGKNCMIVDWCYQVFGMVHCYNVMALRYFFHQDNHLIFNIGNIVIFVIFVLQFRNDCLVCVCDIRILGQNYWWGYWALSYLKCMDGCNLW